MSCLQLGGVPMAMGPLSGIARRAAGRLAILAYGAAFSGAAGRSVGRWPSRRRARLRVADFYVLSTGALKDLHQEHRVVYSYDRTSRLATHVEAQFDGRTLETVRYEYESPTRWAGPMHLGTNVYFPVARAHSTIMEGGPFSIHRYDDEGRLVEVAYNEPETRSVETLLYGSDCRRSGEP